MANGCLHSHETVIPTRQLSFRLRVEGVESPERLAAIASPGSLSRDQHKSGGYVVDTVTSAFHSLLDTPSVEVAVASVASLGNDADTTRAVTGVLAGSHYGAGAIPAR